MYLDIGGGGVTDGSRSVSSEADFRRAAEVLYMAKEIVSTDDAPAAVGAYSQATVANGFVYTAGQVPLEADGTQVTGSVEEQTRQALDNVEAVLAEAGAGLDDVVKVTVYLDSIEDFDEMNAAYGDYFEEEPPARSAVAVEDVPLDAAVEIEAVAALD